MKQIYEVTDINLDGTIDEYRMDEQQIIEYTLQYPFSGLRIVSTLDFQHSSPWPTFYIRKHTLLNNEKITKEEFIENMPEEYQLDWIYRLDELVGEE